MSKVIALYSSAPQSGKTTVSNYLQKEYGYSPVKFAGPLKDMLRNLLNNFYEYDTAEELVEVNKHSQLAPCFGGKTPRDMLISLGTFWGRDMVNDSIWVDLCLAEIERQKLFKADVVIDDMRFPNEYEALDRLGEGNVELWKIVKMGHEYTDIAIEGMLEDKHFDRVLVAEQGDLRWLRLQVRHALGVLD